MRLLSILLAFVLLLSGCNSRQASEVVPTYNPYVEAFTTGKISRFAPVYLILSQDLPEGADLTGKLKLTPEVEGTWTAENKRTLTFRPAQSFDYATTYRMDADLSDWFETDKDEARFAFSFSTYAFAIRGYQSGLDVSVANEDSLDIHYVLQTSDREMPERVEKLVSYPLGRAVWQHSPDGRRHELTLRDVPKKENGYTLDDKAAEYAKTYFKELYEERDENFGNARDVRNVFERAVARQSDRVAVLENPGKEELMALTTADLQEEDAPQTKESNP